MRRLLIILCLIIASQLHASSALAAEEPIESCQTFDLTQSLDNWQITAGAWEDGTGVIHEDDIGTVRTDRRAWIGANIADILNLPEARVIYINVTMDVTMSTAVAGLGTNMWRITSNLGSLISLNFSQTTSGNNIEFVYDGTAEIDFIGVIIAADVQDNGDPLSGSVTLKSIELCVEGEIPPDEYIRPLLNADIDPVQLIAEGDDPELPYTVNAVSVAPGANVYSAVAGTIESIERAGYGACEEDIDSSVFDSIPRLCNPRLPNNNDGFHFIEHRPLTELRIFRVVLISDEDGSEFIYYLNDAPSFLRVGQQINAGCIMGRTATLRRIAPIDGGQIGIPESEFGVAVLVRKVGGQAVELLDSLTIPPVEGNACNVDPDNSNCLGDGALERSEEWTTQGEVSFQTAGGAFLSPQSSIRTEMNLDSDRSPAARASARAVTSSTTMTLRIGLTQQEYTVATGDFATYELPGAAHEPDAGIFFTVMVENLGEVGLELDSLCIYMTLDSGGNPVDPPPDPGDPDDPDDGFPDNPPPFYEDCSLAEQPGGETLVDQIGWLWARLNGFFQCDLMRLLNRIWETTDDILYLFKWQARYWQTVSYEFWDWVTLAVFPWLEGHFANIALGQQTFVEINNGEDQCGNLFCLVDSLFGGVTDIFGDLADLLSQAIGEVIAPLTAAIISLVNRTVGFFFDLLSVLLALFLQIATQIISAFDRVINLFNIVVSLWNDTEPATLPFIPNCSSNPQGNIYCGIMWLAENTVLAGPGGLLIPLLIGFASIMLLIWAVGEIKKLIIESGQVK